jgi:hypothetical protein
MTPHEISGKGFDALVKELGPGAALQFINQYETGAGDYTKERKKLFHKTSLDGIKQNLIKTGKNHTHAK